MGLRESAAHVFVADLTTPVVDEADRHHLERVLRLRAGEVVTVCDGAGSWRPCRWLGGGAAEIEAAGDVVVDAALQPLISIGFALTKGDRAEWVVQKLTELGVDRILPFAAARSVVRWDRATAERHLLRWRRVAREAAMQSRRTLLPMVRDVVGFVDGIATGGAAMAEPGGDRLCLDRPTVVVGPEGGWSPEELATGLATVDLGPGVLRADTAAVAAGVLLCALRSGAVGSPAGGSV